MFIKLSINKTYLIYSKYW